MKEIENKNNIPDPAVNDEEFKGYTMEELRYQRAMVALRKEFCKAKLVQTVQDLRPKRDEKAAKSGSKLAMAGKIASKVFSNLNTFDYIMMGISIFNTAKKGYHLIKGRKS